MSKLINNITAKQMLRMVGKIIIEEAENRSKKNNSFAYNELPNFNSLIQPIIASKTKGIIVLKTIFLKSGTDTTVVECLNKCFAFKKEHYDDFERRMPKEFPELSTNDDWAKNQLFCLKDYEENQEIITYLCDEIDWIDNHLAIGDIEKSFKNRKHYQKILDKATKWANE